jgi:hypothetical protein
VGFPDITSIGSQSAFENYLTISQRPSDEPRLYKDSNRLCAITVSSRDRPESLLDDFEPLRKYHQTATDMASEAVAEQALPDGVHHFEDGDDIPENIQKYWHQRYDIFSKYDEGIWMTDDAWFGVTPEPVAK